MDKLLIISVDVNPNQCILQRINLENGEYYVPFRTNNEDYFALVNDIAKLIRMERPSRLVFDVFGLGEMFKAAVLRQVEYEYDMAYDEFGVRYH